MSLFELSKEEQSQLARLEEKFKSTANADFDKATLHEVDEFWGFLKNAEQIYFNRTEATDDTQDEMEFGYALYYLNHEIAPSFTVLLQGLGMPSSSISLQQAQMDFESIAWVNGNGTLFSSAKYSQLDLGWLSSLHNYLHFVFHKSEIHPFITTPSIYTPTDPDNKTIAIIGDWGTGIYADGSLPQNPAKLVIDGIMSLKPLPDIIVHLGDVYYSGLGGEEQTNLLDMIPEEFTGKIFTMNSNHEMYDGANGLYEVSLKNNRFTHQNNCTYFAIDLGNYKLVGLDSAYYDKSFMYMTGSLSDGSKGGEKQLQFLTDQAAGSQELILCTHHVGIKYDAVGVNDLLFGQVIGALGGHKAPDYWYWGHVHNGIVYKENLSIVENYTDGKLGPIYNSPKLRCCGHASIPFGNGTKLHKPSEPTTPIDQVAYYANSPLGASDPVDGQRLRVLNGFALLTISGGKLTEKFYEVKNGWDGPKEVWPFSEIN